MCIYFKILFIALSIILSSLNQPIFADSVGTVEDNKSLWYAVIKTENKGKKLYVKGDIFSSAKNPAKSFRILDIEKDSLILEDVISKNSIMMKPGEAIPIEEAGMIFEKTVESSVIEYNYNRSPKKFTKNQLEDFTIKSLEKKKIVLEKPYNALSQAKQLSNKEKEIFNSPRDKDTDKTTIIAELFNKIDSKEIGHDVWALDSSSAEPAIRNAGAALISAIKRVEPRYRLGEGPSLQFNTDLGTAVVNKEGFLIQNIAVAKLAENFGIRQGDIIKSINGYPVNNLLGIYRVYENISSNKDTRLLHINIARDGKNKTLIYKIR
jgi:hypothetical protein